MGRETNGQTERQMDKQTHLDDDYMPPPPSPDIFYGAQRNKTKMKYQKLFKEAENCRCTLKILFQSMEWYMRRTQDKVSKNIEVKKKKRQKCDEMSNKQN